MQLLADLLRYSAPRNEVPEYIPSLSFSNSVSVSPQKSHASSWSFSTPPTRRENSQREKKLYGILNKLHAKRHKYFYTFFITLQTMKKNDLSLYDRKITKVDLSRFVPFVPKIQMIRDVLFFKHNASKMKTEAFNRMKRQARRERALQYTAKVIENVQYRTESRKLMQYLIERGQETLKMEILIAAIEDVARLQSLKQAFFEMRDFSPFQHSLGNSQNKNELYATSYLGLDIPQSISYEFPSQELTFSPTIFYEKQDISQSPSRLIFSKNKLDGTKEQKKQEMFQLQLSVQESPHSQYKMRDDDFSGEGEWEKQPSAEKVSWSESISERERFSPSRSLNELRYLPEATIEMSVMERNGLKACKIMTNIAQPFRETSFQQEEPVLLSMKLQPDPLNSIEINQIHDTAELFLSRDELIAKTPKYTFSSNTHAYTPGYQYKFEPINSYVPKLLQISSKFQSRGQSKLSLFPKESSQQPYTYSNSLSASNVFAVDPVNYKNSLVVEREGKKDFLEKTQPKMSFDGFKKQKNCSQAEQDTRRTTITKKEGQQRRGIQLSSHK